MPNCDFVLLILLECICFSIIKKRENEIISHPLFFEGLVIVGEVLSILVDKSPP